MNKFTFFWRTGEVNVVEGETVDEAFNSAWSGGAIAALDFWAAGDIAGEYSWVNGQWVSFPTPTQAEINIRELWGLTK